jgi:ribosomal protein S18 acetylase RimI-like enzyme
MSDVIVRRAASSDVEKIVGLRLLLQQHCEKSNPSIWRMTKEGERLLKQKVGIDLANDDIRILLAELKGQVIGFVQGEITLRSDYLPRIVGSVSVIYVLKEFRRKGVGKRLIKELCEFFNSEKVGHLTLRYIIGNKEAEQFWRKLGFEPMITTAGTHPKELDFKLKTME